MLRKLLGRRTGVGQTPVSGIVDDALSDALLGQLFDWVSPRYRSGVLRERTEAYRTLGAAARQAALPRLYQLFEQFLTEVDDGSGWTRPQLRRQVQTLFPTLVQHGDFHLLFSAETRQEILLCRNWLEKVMKDGREGCPERLRDRFGRAARWLREVPDTAVLPAPFGLDSPQPQSERGWVVLLGSLASTLRGELDSALGIAACDRLYEASYNDLAGRFGNLTTFPVLVGLLPERLIDERRAAMWSLRSARHELLDKLEREQTINQHISESNEQLLEVQRRLEQSHGELHQQVRQVDGDLRVVNDRLRREIAERAQTESALRTSEARFRSLVESARDAIALFDAEGNVVLWNRNAKECFGYSTEEALGLSLADIVPARYRTFYRNVLQRLGSKASDNDSGLLDNSIGLHKDGTEFPIEMSLSSWRSGTATYHGAIIRDVSDRIRAERQLRVLADRDPLTHLFNRRRFQLELDRELSVARRHSLSGALLVLDLDEFKEINDTLGHHVGDALIRGLAARIQERVRTSDILARLGGDEFALYLPRADAERASVLAADLLDQVRHHTLDVATGKPVGCSVSIGVALFGEHGTTVEELLSNADTAMYQAKNNGRNSYAVFSPAFDRGDLVTLRLTWENRIRQALATDGFLMHFQPIVRLHDGRVGSYEALLRMVDENHQLILPDQFLGIAERYGLIRDIDRWVARRALEVLGDWRESGFDASLSVNLSAKAFTDPELPGMLESELRQRSIDPCQLVFEITESAAIADLAHARDFIERVRRFGCGFALDDFGTGFSSFNNLKYLPVDYLKIDGSFIRDLKNSVVDQNLVRAMVQVARGLGQHTIAEFVGDEQTTALLQSYGVDFGQGFQMGRPSSFFSRRAVVPNLGTTELLTNPS